MGAVGVANIMVVSVDAAIYQATALADAGFSRKLDRAFAQTNNCPARRGRYKLGRERRATGHETVRSEVSLLRLRSEARSMSADLPVPPVGP